MKKIITWLKPTWAGLHIWNYLWAFKPFLDVSKWADAYIFLADYHSLTSVHDGETLAKYRKNMLIEYFALMTDEELDRITIFEQSKVKRINDITWILSSVTPLSLMLRAHSYKDAKAKNSEINMATFNYPILMAADIITYDIDLVPVWKDQIQHLEFARDIAENFNKTYKEELFSLPSQYVMEEVQTIPGLDGRKMSKSYDNFIPIFASEKELKKLVMKIVTDDKPLEEPKNPDTCNVFSLIKYFATEERQSEIRAKYEAGNYWYGHAKLELLEILNEYLKNYRERRDYFEANFDVVEKKLAEGSEKANAMADSKYREIVKIIWLPNKD